MLQPAKDRPVVTGKEVPPLDLPVDIAGSRRRLAFVYIRVSTKKQAEKHSLDKQKADCLAYARKRGIIVVFVYTDVGSGLSLKHRPGFVEMCDRALDKNNGVTDVIFWDLDRFTRRNRHFYEYSEDLVDAGVTLHLASEEEEYNHNTAISWQQRMQAAEIESRKIAKRTKSGQAEATEKGLHIGPPPWGYLLKHEEGEEEICGRLVPDPDLWPHVLRLWRMSAEGYVPQTIAYTYDQEGIPPPGPAGWNDDAVRYILKNEKYKGNLFRGKERKSRLPGPKDHSPPAVSIGAHEGAVSEEDFEKIQRMMRKRNRNNGATRSHSSPNPASDILRCGECGEEYNYPTMTVSKKGDTRHLRCARKKKLGKAACPNDDVRLDFVLENMLAHLKEDFLEETVLRNVVKIVQDNSGEYLQEMESRQANLRANLGTVRAEIANINQVFRKAGAKADNLTSLVDNLLELEQKERELEEEIARNNEDSDEARLFLNDPEGIITTALNLKTYTEYTAGPAVRDLIQMFIQRAEIYRWTGDRRVLKLWLALPARTAESTEAPGEYTIAFDRQGERVPSESCLFGGSRGLG